MVKQDETQYIFGIYLGKTSSCVAVTRETGNPEAVNVDGRYTIPSVENFHEKQLFVGVEAEENEEIDQRDKPFAV